MMILIMMMIITNWNITLGDQAGTPLLPPGMVGVLLVRKPFNETTSRTSSFQS